MIQRNMRLEKRILLWVICSNIGATAGGFVSVLTGFQFLISVLIGLTLGLLTAFIIDYRYRRRRYIPDKLASGKIYTNGISDKRKKPAS
jgi:uncharacterized membrane-anchored protein